MAQIAVVNGSNGLAEYYARRAPEYERIYEKPERQGELAELRALVREKTFAGKDVLEVACGTGYWTQEFARGARSVTAVDINEEVLEIARAKAPNASVLFRKGDLYDLKAELGMFSAGLAAFWWSHMPKGRVAAFLRGFHERLVPGAVVMFMDNCYAAQSSTPISRTDVEGNTFQMRRLEDGSVHEVRKNFPTEAELREAVAGVAQALEVRMMRYYWMMKYRVS